MDTASNTSSENSATKDALRAVKLDPAVLEAQIRESYTTAATEEDHQAIIQPNSTTEVINEDADGSSKFEEMLRIQKAALLSLAPQQFEMLLKYASVLRMQRQMNQRHLECAFCKTNGEPSSWYSSHVLKDPRGRVRCPVLRRYHCPSCGATGDHAHTIKYCPDNFDADRWSR